METIGSIIREIKNCRREMNRCSNNEASTKDELIEKYRQEEAYAIALQAQAKRLERLAKTLIGSAQAAQEATKNWIELDIVTTPLQQTIDF